MSKPSDEYLAAEKARRDEEITQAGQGAIGAFFLFLMLCVAAVALVGTVKACIYIWNF